MSSSKIGLYTKIGSRGLPTVEAPLSESLLVLKSPKDGLQVYALTFADERGPNGILTISRCPFYMKGCISNTLSQRRLKGERLAEEHGVAECV